jgi:tetratricopeptide (TPR) repeat protein
MSPDRYRGIVLALALVLAALALGVYWSATENGFVWDDPIVFDQQINAFHSGRDVLQPPKGIPQFGSHYYRPTIVATYLLDQALFGRDSFGYHLSVLLWHALATVLVFLLGLQLCRSPEGSPWELWPPALGGALFALHPIHTESVVWMTGRSDTVAAVFVLGALILHLRGRRATERSDRLPAGIASVALVVAALAALLALPGEGAGPSGWGLPIVLALAVLAGGILLAVLGWSGRWHPVALYGPAAVLLLLGAGGKETALGMLLLLPVLPFLLPVAPPPSKEAEPAAEAARGRSARKGKKRKSRKEKGGKQKKAAAAAPASYERMSQGLDRAFGVAVSFLPYAIVAVVYLVFRSRALGGLVPSTRPSGGALETLRDLLSATAWYLRKISWPEPLTALVGGVPEAWWFALLGLLGAAACLGLLLLFRRLGWGKEAFSLAIFFAFLAPPMTIVFKRVSETVLAERYLYLPSVGACLLAAFLLGRLVDRLLATGLDRRVAVGAALLPAVVVGSVWAASIRQRIPEWADDLSFWSDAAEKEPNHGIPHLHYGMALADQLRGLYEEAFRLRGQTGDEEGEPSDEQLARAEELERQAAELDRAAEEAYLRAWEVYDDNEGRFLTSNNLGTLLMGRGGRLTTLARRESDPASKEELLVRAQGEYDAAVAQFRRAIRIQPSYHKARFNWGTTEGSLAGIARLRDDLSDYTRHYLRALPLYDEAISVNPRYYKAYAARAGLLLNRRLPGEAAAAYELAARWAGSVADRDRSLQRAAQARERLEGQPESPRDRALARFEQAERARASGRPFTATGLYWGALRLDPQLARAWAAWGEMCGRRLARALSDGAPGRVLALLRQSEERTRKALEISPGDPVVRLARANHLLRADLTREALEQTRAIASGAPLDEETARQLQRFSQAARARSAGEPAEVPTRVRALLERGDRALGEGRPADAALSYWAATRLAPRDSVPALRLGELLRQQAEALEEGGESHRARELFVEAAREMGRAGEIDSGLFAAWSGAGESYLAAGEAVAALDPLSEALRTAPDPDARGRIERRLEEARAASKVRIDE